MKTSHFLCILWARISPSLLLPPLGLVTSECWNASRLSFGPRFSLFVFLPSVMLLIPMALNTSSMLMTPKYVSAAQACPEFHPEISNLWLRLHGYKREFWLFPPVLFHVSKSTLIHPVAEVRNLGITLNPSRLHPAHQHVLPVLPQYRSHIHSLLCLHFTTKSLSFSTGRPFEFPNWSSCFHLCVIYTVLTADTVLYWKHLATSCYSLLSP